MNHFDLGIAYYASVREQLESLIRGSDEEKFMRLVFELLIENESRYQARSEFLLKNKVLQMQFGDYRIEYYIRNSYVTFSYSEDNGATYLQSRTMPLNGNVESDIETIVDVIAQGEAQLLLAG